MNTSEYYRLRNERFFRPSRAGDDEQPSPSLAEVSLDLARTLAVMLAIVLAIELALTWLGVTAFA